MKFSKEQIEKLGYLARIKLTEKEKEKFTQELSRVLEYIEQLQKVDTKDIKPISQITGFKNITRDDEIEITDEVTKKEILDNFPDKERGFVKTKRILEN